MSKAEKRAFEVYPKKMERTGRVSYDMNELNRLKFLQGYHQAEKDLELTWEDIERIDDISLRLDCTDEAKGMSNKEFYQEVLKQFNKEWKGK